MFTYLEVAIPAAQGNWKNTRLLSTPLLKQEYLYYGFFKGHLDHSKEFLFYHIYVI